MDQGHLLFSYATKDLDEDISVLKMYQNHVPLYIVSIGGEEVQFRAPDSYLRWKSSCVTWESETGVTTLSVGKFVLARRVAQKGYRIGPSAVIRLGKSLPYTSFSGEIKDVYMWNVTIPMRDLKTTSWGSLLPSPVINWRNLQYEIQGNVTLV